jgi:hypothetical protein
MKRLPRAINGPSRAGASGCMGTTMLHLAKLAVGIRDIAHLREVQAGRLAAGSGLRHLTRNFPRRAPEVLAGGSLYWVIQGAMVVRQRIVDITAAQYDDGSRCAALCLDPALVAVAARPVRAFQGWRYLAAEAAPPDLSAAGGAETDDALPPRLRRALRDLALL